MHSVIIRENAHIEFHVEKNGDVCILDLWVAKHDRNKGVGTSLILECLEMVNATLVKLDNVCSASKIYTNCGFHFDSEQGCEMTARASFVRRTIRNFL